MNFLILLIGMRTMKHIDKVAIVSSCYGLYDEPKPPTIQVGSFDVEYIMVHDGQVEWPGWINVVEKRPHLHDNVAAKVVKVRPDLYTDADYIVWIDAGSYFTENLVTSILDLSDMADWALFTHPGRVHLLDEVAVSRLNRKYDPMSLEQQAASYLADGYPDDRLWATGVMGRFVTPFNQQFGDAWLREVCKWSFQDQLSFAYLDWKLGLNPQGFRDSHQLSVEWVTFANHVTKPF